MTDDRKIFDANDIAKINSMKTIEEVEEYAKIKRYEDSTRWKEITTIGIPDLHEYWVKLDLNSPAYLEHGRFSHIVRLIAQKYNIDGLVNFWKGEYHRIITDLTIRDLLVLHDNKLLAWSGFEQAVQCGEYHNFLFSFERRTPRRMQKINLGVTINHLVLSKIFSKRRHKRFAYCNSIDVDTIERLPCKFLGDNISY